MRRTHLLPVPLVLALVLAACGGDAEGHDAGHGGNSAVPDGARTVEVAASSFEFDPDRIEVDAGEAIEVELTATDVEHDFVIDELDAHVAAEAGEAASGGFVAGEPGTYTYYCSVAGHREAGMEGELVVR